jgi:hypothetical protein
MKLALSLTALVLLGATVVWLYGDRLIASRFTVAKYTYVLPADGHGAITEGTVLTGLNLALQANTMDPSAWAPAPAAQWEPPGALLQTSGRMPSILIPLSNRVDRSHLYLRVEPGATTNALQYHIYRPK